MGSGGVAAPRQIVLLPGRTRPAGDQESRPEVGTSKLRLYEPNAFGTQPGTAASSAAGSQHHAPSTMNLYSYRPGSSGTDNTHSPSAPSSIEWAEGSQSLKVPAKCTERAPGAWTRKTVSLACGPLVFDFRFMNVPLSHSQGARRKPSELQSSLNRWRRVRKLGGGTPCRIRHTNWINWNTPNRAGLRPAVCSAFLRELAEVGRQLALSDLDRKREHASC